MHNVYNEYKKAINYFLTNKKYVISIILITILSYGFYITKLTVGVDDLCQDRYITGTYLLSQGRWGNVLAANLLNIKTFVPFWTEFITVVLLVINTILLCAFLKKEIGEKINKDIYYILFSGILISYPLTSNIFLYNFANIITEISNIAMTVLVFALYENIFNKINNCKTIIIIIILLPFVISMYEASCQLYLLLTFALAFIMALKNENTQKICKFIICSVLLLIAGIIFNEFIICIIKQFLSNTGNLTPDYSSRRIGIINFKNTNLLKVIKINIIDVLLRKMKSINYISMFFIISIISLIISIVKSIKEKNAKYIILNVFIILVNFSMMAIQLRILYRTCTSWAIAIAFMSLYILCYSSKKNYINTILISIFCMMVLYNSKTLTSEFYNDYIRYEREKNIAFDIANTIIRTCDNPKKPIVYVLINNGDIQGNSINVDNGWSVINWGTNAFGEYGTETTKFINSFGYNLTTATNDEVEAGIEEYKKISEKHKKDFLIELDDCIIVKLVYEQR